LAKARKDSSAMRTRRYRERKKGLVETVTPSVTVTPDEPLPNDVSPVIAEPVQTAVVTVDAKTRFPNDFNPHVTHTPRHKTCAVTLSTTMSALALATVSAGFSITGMTSIFVGAFLPVIAMGVALEAGKLSAVAWLARHRSTAPWRLRTALVALVAVLMALNAIGAYGFLAKAHIGHAVDGDVAAAGLAADIDARISVQSGVVSDLDRRIAQIDRAVDTATAKGRTKGAMELAADQRKARTELVAQRTTEAKTLASYRQPSGRTRQSRWSPPEGRGRPWPCPIFGWAQRMTTCCGGSFSPWRCCSIRLQCCCLRLHRGDR
jgi:hypothetical protein